MNSKDELNKLEIRLSCAEPALNSLDGNLPITDESLTKFLENAFQQAGSSEKTAIAVAYLLGRNQQKSGEVKRSKGRPKGSTKFDIPTDFARYLAYPFPVSLRTQEGGEQA